MRWQSLYIFSVVMFLFFNVSNNDYTMRENVEEISNEQNSTKNLAAGNGFEEKIFAEESNIGEKVHYRKIEIGTDGNIYVRGNLGEIIIFTPKGEFVKRIKKTDIKFDDRKDYIVLFPKFEKENSVIIDGLSREILACKEDKEGNVYLSAISAVQGGSLAKILKYNEEGEKLFEIFVPIIKYSGPIDLEIDDFGNFVVANTTYNTLDVYNKNGKFLYRHYAKFEREEWDGMSGLCDIELDESGNIYAIDRYANQIKKFTLIKKTMLSKSPEVRLKKLMKKSGKNIDNEELLNTIRQLNRTTDPETIKNLINTFPKVIYFTQDYRLEEDLILTLASIGEPAIPFLIEALENPNREVRLSVIKVLILNNNQTVIIPLMNCLKKSSKNDGTNWTGYITRVFLKIDNIPIKTFLEILKDDDKYVQLIGIKLLRTTKDKQVISSLIIEMKKNPRFRAKFADALGLIGDKTAIPYLIEILKSENDMCFTGKRIIIALGKLKAKEAVDIIIERGIKNEDHYVRQRSGVALREIGDPRAISVLKKAIETEENENVIHVFTWAIKELEKKTQK